MKSYPVVINHCEEYIDSNDGRPQEAGYAESCTKYSLDLTYPYVVIACPVPPALFGVYCLVSIRMLRSENFYPEKQKLKVALNGYNLAFCL
ncbi:hypothetical protein EB796_019316 [Bugula neritina]|uniref:Uncharacterized protein n=1 Tax=Bugula neritina TaxID=10212 RepID=A0A7J7J9Q6_BUGNE|nr:hypothetical protein EB796_019316 [Bugula neritina]